MTTRWQEGVVRGGEIPAQQGGLTVLKIGGSLLALASWPRLLESLVSDIGDRDVAIVVGGGPVVDGLRSIDAAAPQAPEVMHDLAIDAMHLTAELVSRSTGLPIRPAPGGTAAACVLDVPLWMISGTRSRDLPASWDVTSDSIAARVAHEYGADLLLAKAAPPPSSWCGESLLSLAGSGWVDRYFPIAAAEVARIRWTAPAVC